MNTSAPSKIELKLASPPKTALKTLPSSSWKPPVASKRRQPLTNIPSPARLLIDQPSKTPLLRNLILIAILGTAIFFVSQAYTAKKERIDKQQNKEQTSNLSPKR